MRHESHDITRRRILSAAALPSTALPAAADRMRRRVMS